MKIISVGIVICAVIMLVGGGLCVLACCPVYSNYVNWGFPMVLIGGLGFLIFGLMGATDIFAG